MGNSVSEILAGGYEYLGRPSQDKLNLGQALAFTMDAIDFYCADLLISDENFLLRSYTFTPSRKDDEMVAAPGFSLPVLMELRDIGSVSDSDWRGILTANASDIQDLARDGTRAVAFYGSGPTMMRWSFDPVLDWQVEARLWYEPVASQPTTLTASPRLSQAFAAMIKIRWARTAIPYCGFEQKEAKDLFAVLTIQLNEWKEKWNWFVNSDKNARPVQRRDFRGGRKYGRYPGGRVGWGWW